MSFEKWAAHVKKWEGGWADDPVDRGGKTNMGLTWDTFKVLAQSVLKMSPTLENFKALQPDHVKRVMRYFWNTSGANEIHHPGVAFMVAEIAWGSGFKQSGLTLQRVMNRNFGANLREDGVISTKTHIATNKVNGDKLLSFLLKYREKWLHQVVANRPEQKRFINGWMNRLNDAKRILAGFLRQLSPKNMPEVSPKTGIAAVITVGVILILLSRK